MGLTENLISMLLPSESSGDKTFHEIIDHTRYVCEKEFSQGYKFKGGMWEQQGIYGNFSAHYGYFPELYINGSDNFGNYNRYVMSDLRCYRLVPVLVVFENDIPIYAIVPRVDEIFTSLQIDMSPKFSSWALRDRHIYYMNKGDYRIDSFNMTGEIFSPSVSDLHWADYRVGMQIGGTIIYSYQPYTIDESGDTPQLITDGQRISTTFSGGGGSNIPYVAGLYTDIYSDMSNDDLYWKMHDIYDSMFDYLNLPTYPVEVYLPN